MNTGSELSNRPVEIVTGSTQRPWLVDAINPKITPIVTPIARLRAPNCAETAMRLKMRSETRCPVNL